MLGGLSGQSGAWEGLLGDRKDTEGNSTYLTGAQGWLVHHLIYAKLHWECQAHFQGTNIVWVFLLLVKSLRPFSVSCELSRVRERRAGSLGIIHHLPSFSHLLCSILS